MKFWFFGVIAVLSGILAGHIHNPWHHWHWPPHHTEMQAATAQLTAEANPDRLTLTTAYVAAHKRGQTCRDHQAITAIEVYVNDTVRQVKTLAPACQGQSEVTLAATLISANERNKPLKLQTKVYAQYKQSGNNKPEAVSNIVTLSWPVPAASPVTWSPSQLSIASVAGTSSQAMVTFKSETRLDKLSIGFSDQVKTIVSASLPDSLVLQPGTTYQLPLEVSIPLTMIDGEHSGMLDLLSDNKKVSSLPVHITTTRAQAGTVPSTIALPTPDRLAAWHDTTVARDELLVGLPLTDASADTHIKNIAAETNAVIMGSIADAHMYQLRFSGLDLNQLETKRQQVAMLGGVDFVSHHILSSAASTVPNDPEFGDWDELHPAGNNWGQEFVKAPEAWDQTTGHRSVGIGVIDTGFNPQHEDLSGNAVSATGIMRLFAGRPVSSHGNLTSGIACATGNNGKGIAGMSWQCSLGMYSLYGNSSGDPQDTARRQSAVDAANQMINAAKQNMRVVNMSLQWIDTNDCSKPGNQQTERDAAEYNKVFGRAMDMAKLLDKDVLWVLSAGNECRDVKYSAPAGLAITRPDNVMVVGAIGPDGNLWEKSNRGSGVSVAAPGVGIHTTDAIACSWLIGQCASEYADADGTSLATPFVTGTAGLVLSAHSDYSAKQVKACIVNGATDSVLGSTQPFKILNAAKAITCSPPPSDPCLMSTSLNPVCQSTNPTVTLQRNNTSNTTGCTFSVHVKWGDGSEQEYTLPGLATIGLSPYANHIYAQPGHYDISVTGRVTAGFCSISDASYDFTLLVKP